MALLCGALLYCKGPQNPDMPTQGAIRMSITSGSPINLSKGQATIPVKLDSAKILLKKIEIENVNDDSLDFMAYAPVVISIGMNAPAYLMLTGVPFGAYEEFEACIDSVYAWGSVGADTAKFYYANKVWIEYEKELYPPIIVSPDSAVLNISLYFDTELWFLDWRYGYLDPRNPLNKNKILQNIKQSFYMEFDNDEDDNDDNEDDDDN
jgi:hypothetical protein